MIIWLVPYIVFSFDHIFHLFGDFILEKENSIRCENKQVPTSPYIAALNVRTNCQV